MDSETAALARFAYRPIGCCARLLAAAVPGRARCLIVAALYVLAAGAPARGADLPVACGAGACAGGPSVWVTSGQATSAVTGTRLDVRQTTDKAILNWSEFNVGAGNTVNFQQPGENSLAINKIFQNSPSQIFGNLTANGQVYLINRNGILFGQGSQVNVRGLVASSLDIADEAAENGILSPKLLPFGKPAFEGDGRVYVLDENGQVVTDGNGQPIPVRVAVEEGATLKAAKGGRVALFGQQVENAGTIESPDGQAVLAAGQKVYLQASSNPDLRGLLVEVDAGGTAWNHVTGNIASDRGNVSLVGLAVNQDGRVSATTSVRANGSIRLLARDTVSVVNEASTVTMSTSNAGSVMLGGASRTAVLPDPDDTELAVDEQAQAPSTVEVVGRQVTMQSGSSITVPGGQVSLSALPNPNVSEPSGTEPLPADEQSVIRLEAGSRIDVSGSDAEVSVTRNLVPVELRANELRDSPAQRDGALRGATVIVDARVGTPFADVSGTVSASLKRDVFERTSTGGSVTLNSQGSVAVSDGATIDVSGGVVTYTGGVIATSKLVRTDGSLVDIGTADPNATYRGVFQPVFTTTSRKWGTTTSVLTPGLGYYDPGYFDGAGAGTLAIAAPQMLVNGTLLGSAVNGVQQREADARALGGRLVIGLSDGQGLGQPDFRAPSVTFVNSVVPGNDPVTNQLWLSTDYLTAGGFSTTEIYSNGIIEVPAETPLNLAGGSSLFLRGGVVDIEAAITAPGGDVRANAVLVNSVVALSGDRRPAVAIGDGVTISASGVWVNDTPTLAGLDPVDPLWIDGGRVDLSVTAPGGELVLGDGVTIGADAGAWLQAGGSLQYGSAGTIGIQARGAFAALDTGDDLQLHAAGFKSGGSLVLAANQVSIGASGGGSQRSDPQESGASPYQIGPAFFSAGGFQNYAIVATGGRLGDGPDLVEPLTVESDANLEPQVQLLTFDEGFRLRPTGTDPGTFTSLFLPLVADRPAANLRLAIEPHSQVTVDSGTAGNLLIESGSRIAVEAGGSVALSASRQIEINGLISAPAGRISVGLTRPPSRLDAGFDPLVGIIVGATGQLDAKGTSLLLPSNIGLRQGEVLDGGSISLTADRGRIDLRAGSSLDVSGIADFLDLPAIGAVTGGAPLVRQEVASRGGSLSLVAAEGITLDGTLRGASGGAGPTRPEGGSLAIGVSHLRGWDAGSADLLPTYPTTPRQIIVGGAAPAGGDENGSVRFDPSTVAAGGIASLTLQADDAIAFGDDVQLAVANRLALQAPNLRAIEGVTTVGLEANSVSLGTRLLDGQVTQAASGGGAALTVEAGLVDVVGNLALQGFGETLLDATSDVRFTGVPRLTPGLLGGSLSAAGVVTLRAAQIYPTTYTDFTVSVAPTDGGELGILGRDPGPAAPLSGGGRLTMRAGDIYQGGVIRAPLGQVSLEATDSLVLAEGSLTSVSADGAIIPFGKVIAGRDWYYESSPGVPLAVGAPVGKLVSLSGVEVQLQEGATVDVRGGGDLYAYEFVPGPGGSVDALSPDVNPGLYALLPGGNLPFAPFDTQEYVGSGLRPGDSIYISGIPGVVAEGVYVLLPARYALLPGALLVEAAPGTTDIVPGETSSLLDGTPVTAGYRTVAGTTLRDSRTQGFAIHPGSYARDLAEYRDSFANEFFADAAAAADSVAPRLPRDSGDLRIAVGQLLKLSGDLLAGAGEKGLGARVDVSADNLEIVSSAGGAMPGVVQVEAGALTRLGASSLLLGGTRQIGTDTVTLTPAASSVMLAAGVELTGPETLLLAKDQVSIGAGARLAAAVPASGAASDPLLIAGSGGSALLRVSSAGQASLTRETGAAATGDILIGDGAQVEATGSIIVDAAGTARSFGTIDVSGGSLRLGSRRIALGVDQAGEGDPALQFSNSALAALNDLSELRIAASESLEFAGPVVLGGAAGRPGRLVLDAPVFAGSGADASLQADQLVLGNSAAAAGVTPAQGTGRLQLTAEQIEFDSGSVAFDGFATAGLTAATSARTRGEFTLQSGADLAITSPALVGSAGSSLEIRAPGRVVALAGGAGATTATGGLGAALDIEAGNVTADTRLVFPSGRIRLAAEQALALGANSRLDVRGGIHSVGPATVATGGGDILLAARSGDLTQAAGGLVDVSAGSAVGRAGSIGIFSNSSLALGGTVSGTGPDPARSGSARIYAGDSGDFGALNTVLNTGGFARSRYIETGTGDITVASGVVVRADEVTLAASGGSLTLAGAIDAAADGGGRIALAARDDLLLVSGSRVDASNAGSSGEGGDVSLMSAQGQLRVAGGSAIDVTGAGGESNGTVLLRAASSASDMNVAEFAGTVDGAGVVIFEPVVSAAIGPTIDAATISGFGTLLTSYMTDAAAVIRSRLGLDASRDVIRPGLELIGSGDVTLAAEWDFRNWRYDGQPGYLTLRTPGQLTLNADITDAFIRGGTAAAPTLTQTVGPSWSYRLVGGAATDSALPWATAGRLIDSRDAGGIVLANDHVIRTGTGSISLAADSDLALGGRGSLIYTAGEAARAPAPIGIGGARLTRNWVRNGGEITLAAGRDITAAAPTQIMSGWNARSTTGTGSAEWAIDFTRFQQGVAAMAGGIVNVSAGRDISNLSASVLTTGGESADQPGVDATWGGGNIDVAAGRDIRSGVFSTWHGDGSLRAGRSIISGSQSGGIDIHTILSFGEGAFDVSARKDLKLEGVINPTTVSPANAASVYFYTYAPSDSLSLLAAGGDVTLVNNPSAFRQVVGTAVAASTTTFGIYPATLQAAAPSGDINFVTAMRMLPSATGQFEFLAGGSITAGSAGVALLMSDANVAGVPTATGPVDRVQVQIPVQRYSLDGIHIGDTEPVRLVAASGDIAGGTYSLPKQFEAYAGRDVRDTAINGQNTDDRQVSVVRAGRDVSLPEASNGIQLGGPGRLTVLAGRNVDLGFSAGITTSGRTVTAALPGSSGATIDVWAGLAGNPDFAAFNVKYWDEQYEAELADYSAELVPYVESVTGDTGLDQDTVWTAWAGLSAEQQNGFTSQLDPVRQVSFSSFVDLLDSVVAYDALVTGRDDVTASNANGIYLGFDLEEQRPMVDQYFFRELRDSGRDANLGADADFRGGLDAVAALFPAAGKWSGDMSLVFSRVYTLDGGDINLVAPGGLLNVGLATIPATLTISKKPSELGIVAQGPGDVRIFTDGDVLVNQSRVFTLEGGDIVIWSSNGDIDAGRGSKTAISAPPPTITVSPTGEIVVEFSDAIAGSGIRGILVRDDIEPGDVDLVAPTGEVNAGDAGIGSAGNLNIAAPQVVGLDNIQVGGVATGVPAEAGGLASSLTGVSSVASSATDSAESTAAEAASDQQASVADAALGWLEVFVEGFGDSDEDDEKKRRKLQ